MRKFRIRLVAVIALAYLTGLTISSFHRVAWAQFWRGVRGIWAAKPE